MVELVHRFDGSPTVNVDIAGIHVCISVSRVCW